MLNQLRVYKNKVHIANVPTAGLALGITGVPWQAILLMRDFVKGKIATTRYENISWEWMQLPK